MEKEGQIIKANADLLQQYDTLFGISKNVARSIPNVRDGLKPVQRKILYVMNDIARDKMLKVGTIIGEVLKIYKHGDVSVSGALINLGASWRNIIPYISGRGNYGCHDDKTEVLTKNGWKYFTDLTMNDYLLTVNPNSRSPFWEKPSNIFRYAPTNDPWKMIRCENHPELNFNISENHKMLVKGKLIPIRKLRSTFVIDNLITNCSGYIPHLDLSREDNCRLMTLIGIYMNCGKVAVLHRYVVPKSVIEINTEGNAYINTLMDDILTSFNFQQTVIEHSNTQIVLDIVWLMKYIEDMKLTDSHPNLRHIPIEYMHLHPTYIDAFLDAYMISTHGIDIENNEYYTSSKINADRIQLLMYMTGQCSEITEIKPYIQKQFGIPYRFKISPISNQVTVYPKKDLLKTKDYYGTLYCAEVPTYHTLVTRRNGKILISGNSVMGDAPAAPRYIEAMLSPFAKECYFTDKLCIDMVPTDDNTRMEPETLPSMYPTAVINGATGAGFGQSSNICQYNLKDVLEKMLELIDDPNAPGYLIPDSHWGCDIGPTPAWNKKYKNSFEAIYETGYGSYVQSFRYQIDHQRNVVIVTALPAKVLLEDVLREIERLQNENKAFPELKSMSDLSGKDHNDGVWVEFALYEGKNPYRFINKLTTVKDMRKTVKVNVDLVDGLEVVHYSVRSYLLTWYHYRYEYIRAVTSTKLTVIESDIAINNIKLFIFGEGRLDRTIEIFRTSKDKKDIIDRLMKEYHKSTGMTTQQANILSEMSGKDYTKSALQKYKELKVSLQEEHDRLQNIITSKDGIANIIKDQLRGGVKYARPRGAKIIGKQKEVTEDTIVLAINPNQSTIIKLPNNDDSQLLVSNLPSTLCLSMDSSYNAIVFDTNGRYVIVNPGEIPMMKTLDQMLPLNRYIDKQLGTLIGIECLDESCKAFLVVTKMGKVKKIHPSGYKNCKNNTYIGLDEGDTVVSVIGIRNEHSHVIVYTDNGNGQRFPHNTINVTGSTAQGQYMMSLPDGESVMGGFCVNGDNNLVVYITKKGMIRVNHLKYFTARKNKKDWVHLIEVKKPDEICNVVNCSSNDILRVVYNDFTTEDIAVSEIPVDTMNSPMRKNLYRPGKKVLNVKRVVQKEKPKKIKTNKKK